MDADSRDAHPRCDASPGGGAEHHNLVSPNFSANWILVLTGIALTHKTECNGHHPKGNDALAGRWWWFRPQTSCCRESPRLGPEVLKWYPVPVLGVTGSQMPDAEG